MLSSGFFLLRVAVTAAQQNISQQIVRESKIVIPPTGLLKSFNNIANSFFDKQSAIVVQNRTISQIRDKLLPKLMSGRIRVPVANENTEQS
jgi:type I restriction enzyme S subunit